MKSNILYILFCAFIMCSCTENKPENTQKQRPNILFIMADDHAYQAISAYDDKLIQTPNIDRIANEGINEILLTEKSSVNQVIINQFPEFSYIEEQDNDSEFLELIDHSNFDSEIESAQISQHEKEFLRVLYQYSENENFESISNTINDFKLSLNNNSNLSYDDLERAKQLTAILEGVFDYYYSNNVKSFSNYRECPIAKAALGGAMVGAARGFLRGCLRGFLGFNPGSVAAGCIGGMIVGGIKGAVVSAVGASAICATGV